MCSRREAKGRCRLQYFVWYDDNPKLPVMDKIQAAIAAYVTRFSMRPNVVLVNVADHTSATDMTIRSVRHVPPNTFWVGVEDVSDQPIS